ncbi:DJ-1 family glyoxalase III [Clostridium thermarum]|uniref:DJ-1 family glyoxalase III n=1 Tax=Clostridium thermarum TaxID=1716543 RepID=UPI001124BEA8|nr:DJ-1 family glyoxalase III [Clostridium thermarum]
MKTVLLFLAEGFEEIEALTVVDILRRAGVQCDMCSLKGTYVTGSHGIEVKSDICLDDIDQRGYDAVVLPGGPGADVLKNNVRVVQLVKDFYMSGRITAAICAAPIVLAEAGIVNGHNVTSYPSVKNVLDNSVYKEDLVVLHNNILTSRGPATAFPFAYALLEALGLEKEAEELKEGMLYNFANSCNRE